MLLGALASSIPDIDFVAAFWSDAATNLLAHRGFTHSILFGVIAIFGFALVSEHFHKQHKVGWKTWLLLFTAAIGSHLFIDVMNSYGMGLFEPFSHARISFNTVYVADPFFSLWPAIAFVALLLLRPRDARRTFWVRFALVLSGSYLFYCLLNKWEINRDTKKILAAQHVSYTKYFTTPTPLNNWLWFVAAGNEEGFYTGYRSVFDSKDSMDLTFSPRNDSLLAPFQKHEELQKLLRFSNGFYTAARWGDTTVFNVLRFGQVVGWHNPKERFVFHYYLGYPYEENKLVVQRGRFAGWNAETFNSLLRRIRGN